ncbi:hypothetical protein ACYOEI_41630, partial [Singulisphaera rosea]
PADARSVCFLSGDPASAAVEAKETAFPLLGGSRSFVSGSANWPRLGWKADFVGKFVPALSFFYVQGDDIHLFFPNANDLRRIDKMADSLAPMVNLDPNLFRNFDFQGVGGYFSKRSEVALAFLHRVFVKLSETRSAEHARADDLRPPSEETISLLDDDEDDAAGENAASPSEAVTEPVISAQAVFEATQLGGAVGFTVVSATKKGNVWMARDFWTFQDVVYLARLFDRMQRPITLRTGKVRMECSPGHLLKALVDREAADESRT